PFSPPRVQPRLTRRPGPRRVSSGSRRPRGWRPRRAELRLVGPHPSGELRVGGSPHDSVELRADPDHLFDRALKLLRGRSPRRQSPRAGRSCRGGTGRLVPSTSHTPVISSDSDKLDVDPPLAVAVKLREQNRLRSFVYQVSGRDP